MAKQMAVVATVNTTLHTHARIQDRKPCLSPILYSLDSWFVLGPLLLLDHRCVDMGGGGFGVFLVPTIVPRSGRGRSAMLRRASGPSRRGAPGVAAPDTAAGGAWLAQYGHGPDRPLQGVLDLFRRQDPPGSRLFQSGQIQRRSHADPMQLQDTRSHGMEHATDLSILALPQGQLESCRFASRMIQHGQIGDR